MYRIDRSNGKISVTTPYYPSFAPAARDLGGKWAPPAWVFDEREESAVLHLVDDIFGWKPDCKLVDVQVQHAALDGKAQREAEYFGGRLVCRVFSKHDARAKLGDGVIIVTGSASGGGSAKNFFTYIQEGTVFEVRNFPLPMALRLMDQHPEHVRIVRGYDPATDLQQEAADSPELLELISARNEMMKSVESIAEIKAPSIIAMRDGMMKNIAMIDARIAELSAPNRTGEIDASLRDDD